MINEYTLKMLCEKYQVSSAKLVNKNNNILDKGEYLEIDKTLDYLVNELKISSTKIEKCPSILYYNVNVIKTNVKFLKSTNLPFIYVEKCLHILSAEPEELKKVYEYVLKKYGLRALKKTTSILACPQSIIEDVEKLNIDANNVLSLAISINFNYTNIEEIKKLIKSEEYKSHPELFTSRTLSRANIDEIKDMINSEEYKSHPELFTSTTLAQAKIDEIKEIINSEEYKSHPELFTSTTLAHAKIYEIKEILKSEEYKAHPELFTSQTLAHAKIYEIKEILKSEEYKAHPELFTSQTLAHTKIEDIKEMLNSEEYKAHRELFTSQTLAHTKIEDIKEMLNSEEYKAHPELFTSQTLAHAKIENIKEMLKSEEYEAHPELFTSETLAHAKIEDIKEMLKSEEYEAHPELFTSTTLAHAKMEDITELLSMPYWEDIRYKDLLTSSIVAKAKSMIKKLPKLIDIAEYFGIDKCLNTSFLLFSPSQNYALINYLLENGFPLVMNDKLNPIFGKQPGVLKVKYGIDIKTLMNKYPYEEMVEQNAIRC